MEQLNFKMKKLCSETLKTLINELNRPGCAYSEKRFCEQAFALWYANIAKVQIVHFVHNKVVLLTRRRSEQGARNCHQRIFREVWNHVEK